MSPFPAFSGPLKWRYVKDSSESTELDCGWVDKVQWTGALPEPDPIPLPTEWDHLSYTYDPASRRIEKRYDGWLVVRYLYDGGHCIAEYDGNNNLLRRYIYGPAVDEPICMIEDSNLVTPDFDPGALSYYHFDGLGSVIALSDEDGNTAVLYEYSVYGQVASSDPNHPNRFMFTGREFDKETGLYYYRARYYNPEIGRFLQTDPARQGMNWYAYCGNNSTNGVDPSGMTSGDFLDSSHGMLRYHMDDENGPGATFTFSDDASGSALAKWMRWASDYDRACNVDLSTMAGYKLAGGKDNFDVVLFWNVQAMIALGYSEEKIKTLDEGGVTIKANSDHTLQYYDKVVEWDLSGAFWSHEDQEATGDPADWVLGFPALAMLAHELEHGYQDTRGELLGYGDGYNPVAQNAEQRAMMAENEMAYAFYKKVPGYGNGEAHMITGPRTYYATSGMSMMYRDKGYDDVTMGGMKWGSWTKDYVPAY